KCYKLFKKDYPDTWQKILIKFEESTQYTEIGKTLGQWQQLFNKSAKCFTQSFASLSKAHGIEAAFIMAGSIVNQDGSLGYAYTTPRAEDFFMDCYRCNHDTLIGHFKTHIYHKSSLACLAEAFDTEKSDDKGKAKERDDIGCNSWASGKLFPWKQLPQKLGQNSLVCVNWPDGVLFPSQEQRSKPKGVSDLSILKCTQVIATIRDHRPHKLHFTLHPTKSDLVDSRKPVIIGAPPAHDSKLTKARRLFYNGKSDYKG
ncbi:hypothetical protein SCLCIDRAFT_82006, partial [Scleroderma citrinum Foug A]